MDCAELVNRLRNIADGGIYEKCDGCKYEEDYPDCVGCTHKAFYEAADAIEALQKQIEAFDDSHVCRIIEKDGVTELSVVPGWIPVTERLPEAGTRVLVYADSHIDFGILEEDGYWTDWLYYPIRPTHWMPLPTPPKEET